jgi:hypothetical protein
MKTKRQGIKGRMYILSESQVKRLVNKLIAESSRKKKRV